MSYTDISNEELNKKYANQTYIRDHSIVLIIFLFVTTILLIFVATLFLFLGLSKNSKIKTFKDNSKVYRNIINNVDNETNYSIRITNLEKSRHVDNFTLVGNHNFRANAIYDFSYDGIMCYYLDVSFDDGTNSVSGKTNSLYPQSNINSADEIDLCYTKTDSGWIVVNENYKLDKDYSYLRLKKNQKTKFILSIVFYVLTAADITAIAVYFIKNEKKAAKARAIMKYNDKKLKSPKICQFCGFKLKYEYYECPNCGAPVLKEEYDEDKEKLLEALK